MPLPMGKMNEIHARFRINEKKSCVTTVQIIFIRGKENTIKASEHLYQILEVLLREKIAGFKTSHLCVDK